MIRAVGSENSIFFKDELFTEERLEKELKVLKGKPIQRLINGIIEKLRAFSKGAPQSDDITMMKLKFYGE
jgi:serine phosphatase RsbU (regulator of sigma subunit)